MGILPVYFKSTSGIFPAHFRARSEYTGVCFSNTEFFILVFRILKHYERIEKATYCNGQSSISCFQDNKRPLPAARAISNFLEKAHRNKDATNLKRTKILTDMGQFITHDIIQTPDLSGQCSLISGYFHQYSIIGSLSTNNRRNFELK